jgi:hypothetical protein
VHESGYSQSLRGFSTRAAGVGVFTQPARPCTNPHRCYDSLAESSGEVMKGFVQGADRQQTTLLPECLDDWVDDSNPVRAVDVFVDAMELRDLGFDGVDPAATRRPVDAGQHDWRDQ